MQSQILLIMLKWLDQFVPANMKTIYWSVLMIVVGVGMLLFGDGASFEVGVLLLGTGVQGIFQRHATMKLEEVMASSLSTGVDIVKPK